MYPMTLQETGESNGKVSISEMFADNEYNIDGLISNTTLEELFFAVCRGGWPRCLALSSREAKLEIAKDYYEQISGGHEQVGLRYVSHCQRGPLLEVIQRDRMKDRAVGYSLHGVHRDDLEFTLGGHPMRREGSQGQNKTYVIALKLAQFDFLKRTASQTTPLLLLDDIFDKLDADRVEQIVKLVASDEFGQIFITDTNREHLDQILSRTSHDYRIFQVENGNIHV